MVWSELFLRWKNCTNLDLGMTKILKVLTQRGKNSLWWNTHKNLLDPFLKDSCFCSGSERFYHNKNQIFFNKSCCYGPLLDPDKVSQLPEATPPGKVSSVIRTGLEMVAKAAFDPEKVIDLMQEGCGVRVVVKHKGKILKKVRGNMSFWLCFLTTRFQRCLSEQWKGWF